MKGWPTLVAGALIASAIVFHALHQPRYQIAASMRDGWVLDPWAGTVQVCTPSADSSKAPQCTSAPEPPK